MAAVFGSREGIRFPISPLLAEDDGAVGPAVPKAWVGTSGVAEGLLNLAILSLRDPDTARGLGSPEDPPVGGVRFVLDLISANVCGGACTHMLTSCRYMSPRKGRVGG